MPWQEAIDEGPTEVILSKDALALSWAVDERPLGYIPPNWQEAMDEATDLVPVPLAWAGAASDSGEAGRTASLSAFQRAQPAPLPQQILADEAGFTSGIPYPTSPQTMGYAPAAPSISPQFAYPSALYQQSSNQSALGRLFGSSLLIPTVLLSAAASIGSGLLGMVITYGLIGFGLGGSALTSSYYLVMMMVASSVGLTVKTGQRRIVGNLLLTVVLVGVTLAVFAVALLIGAVAATVWERV